MENKTTFEKFKEWEKAAPPNFKEEYMKPLKNEKANFGKIDLEKYADGMNRLKEEFLKIMC